MRTARRDLGRPGLRILTGLLGLLLYAQPAVAERGGVASPRLPGAAGGAAGVPPLTGEFAAREELRPGIEFWKGIFGLYSSDQAVIHHAHHLDVIYEILDFSDLKGNPRADRIRRSRTQAEVARVQAMLRRMQRAGGTGQLSEKERRIYDKLRKARGGLGAAALEENIHVQSGISDRFREGLIISRRYLPEIEEIFREEGLPLQLTRMPFMESTFNVKAHSKAAASGIWQFIPSTGRLYMTIGSAVDERRDPIISSRAAAKLLKHNYSVAQRWPLAVTAYNHGLGGVMRAVRATGSSDIVDIIRNYKGSRFGYASRNFFVELLAAIEVERDYERYFGRLTFPPPFAYDEIRLNRTLLARQLVQGGIGRDELAELNPSLSDRTLGNYYSIPAGTLIRAPLGRGEALVARLNRLRDADLPAAVASGTGRHRVRSGETLSGVARRYGVSRHALARENRISSNARLRIGQVLKVPGGAGPSRSVARSSGDPGRRAVFVRRADPARTFRGEGREREAPTRLAAQSGSFDATAIALGAAERPGRKGGPAGEAPRTARVESPGLPPAAPVSSAPAPRPEASPAASAVAAAPRSAPKAARERAAAPEGKELPAVVAKIEGRASPAPPVRDKPISSPGAVIGAARPARPEARSGDEAEAAEALPGPAVPSVTHVVRRNETLWLIAKKYGVSVSDLRDANGGQKLSPLLPGTRLVVSGEEASSRAVPSVTHVVRRNETLWLIAKKYGVSVSDLRDANGGQKLSPLLPGTRLQVRAAGKTHVVRRNETLWGIARRYRVSLNDLKAANAGKPLSPLKPGTELLIPG